MFSWPYVNESKDLKSNFKKWLVSVSKYNQAKENGTTSKDKYKVKIFTF